MFRSTIFEQNFFFWKQVLFFFFLRQHLVKMFSAKKSAKFKLYVLVGERVYLQWAGWVSVFFCNEPPAAFTTRSEWTVHLIAQYESSHQTAALKNRLENSRLIVSFFKRKIWVLIIQLQSFYLKVKNHFSFSSSLPLLSESFTSAVVGRRHGSMTPSFRSVT